MTEENITKSITYGVGLDIGTMNLVSARDSDKDLKVRRMRDLFLDLPKDAKKMLKLSGVNFVERDEDLLILGDAALEIANVFGKEARRPLKAGLVSPSEIDSLEVLGLMISNVLQKPQIPGEMCCFSVPASPIDIPGQDVVYHKGVFEKIITELGYTPQATNEAMAIIYAETALEGFSGIALSFGSGMTNVALAVHTVEGLSFSVARSGDWIDIGAAKSIGSTQARICVLKEKGINLNNPTDRETEAITFYYKAMIEYVLDNLANRFKLIQGQFALPKPIPMIISGGTSLAGGFMELFNKVFERKRKSFPIEISEIRQAREPLDAVARGLLVLAQQED